jgi:hypothetical protein
MWPHIKIECTNIYTYYSQSLNVIRLIWFNVYNGWMLFPMFDVSYVWMERMNEKNIHLMITFWFYDWIYSNKIWNNEMTWKYIFNK